MSDDLLRSESGLDTRSRDLSPIVPKYPTSGIIAGMKRNESVGFNMKIRENHSKTLYVNADNARRANGSLRLSRIVSVIKPAR